MTLKTFVLSLAAIAAGAASAVSPAAAELDFSDRHTPAEVTEILNDFEADHPSLARVVTIGTSHEGRQIGALKISDDVATDSPTEGDAVFMALHHAREWITVEQVLFLADHLLSNYAGDPQVRQAVDALEIWIVPLVNPDGYEYAFSVDRRWRKNRRPTGGGCVGVDLNRNYTFQWGLQGPGIVVSPDPAADTYFGPSPASEPETQAIESFLGGLDNQKFVVTYHSYSGLWLKPWAHTEDDPPGEKVLLELTRRSIERIQAVNGVTYGEEIYEASGEPTDLIWDGYRTAAFTPELRPLAGENPSAPGDFSAFVGYPFDPDPAYIPITLNENLPAAMALIRDAANRGVWIKDHGGDTGAEPSAVWTASGWSAPFWTSPDISTTPETLNQGATVDLRVRLRNDTGATVPNARVDVFYTDPRVSLEFPNPDAVLIDSRTISVPPGGVAYSTPWTTPVGANSWGELHWCVGVVIYTDPDLPLTTQAERSANIGIRNFHTTDVVEAATLIVVATNFLDVDAELRLAVDPATTRGWGVVLPDFPRPWMERAPARPIERKARLLEATGRLLAPGETIYVPVRVAAPAGAARGSAAEINISGGLVPLVAGEREVVGNGFTYRVVKR
ncbi:MAG: M14 family metallopeptidase [Parvularculaceae bacterium]